MDTNTKKPRHPWADDPVFSKEYWDRVEKAMAADDLADKWIDDLADIIMQAKKDPTLMDMLEQAHVYYSLKYATSKKSN